MPHFCWGISPSSRLRSQWKAEFELVGEIPEALLIVAIFSININRYNRLFQSSG